MNKLNHKNIEAYAPRIKADLISLRGSLVHITLDQHRYLVRFTEPLLWYEAFGLPDNLDSIESYVNDHYIQGKPLSSLGLTLVK